jgi:antitoxin component YwqK of YwqJK toxin-antitoxin module
MKLNNIINKIKSINQNIKFVGEFNDNNLKTGYWEEYYSNGNLDSKGNYINSSRDGYWEWYHANGNLWMKGKFVNGNRDGYWEFYWENGKLWQKGNYINGKFYELK